VPRGAQHPNSVDFSLGNVCVRYGAILDCVGSGAGNFAGVISGRYETLTLKAESILRRRRHLMRCFDADYRRRMTEAFRVTDLPD
jgi:hypothetical protein